MSDGSYTKEEIKDKLKDLFRGKDSLIKDISPFTKKSLSDDNVLAFNPTYEDLTLDLGPGPSRWILKNPEEGLAAIEEVLEEDNYPELDYTGEEEIEASIKDLPNSKIKDVRELREEHIGQYIGLRGIVRRASGVFPKPKIIPYICESCGSRTVEYQERDNYHLEKPVECQGCGKSSNKTNFKSIMKDIKWEDLQELRISERHRDLKAGEQPRDKKAILSNHLVDSVKPSDEVILYGIYRAKFKKDSSKPQTYLDVKSKEVISKEYSEVELEPEEEERVEELAQDPEIFDKVVNSIAPSIQGLEDIKKSIALQLFGGVRKEGQSNYFRGDIHILLAGDPETGKSQLLDYVSKIAPKGVLGSGRGTSGAGLTAATIQEEIAGEKNTWVLEPGVLPLADGGLAAIDEFDKMRSEDRDTIHRALEQQDVRIDKADIHQTLNSRCPVLAAANPQTGRFEKSDLQNPEKRLIEEIDIKPDLRSRFDYTWIITGDRKEEEERELSRHILDLHQELGKPEEEREGYNPPISPEDLRNYIKKAKELNPKITDQAKEELREFYHHIIDKLDIGSRPRLLESLIRSAEASARLHYRKEITKEDSEIVIKLKEEQLKSAKELELLYTGFTERGRTVYKQVRELLRTLEPEYNQGIPKEELLGAAKKDGLDPEELKNELERLRDKGQVYTPVEGRYKLA